MKSRFKKGLVFTMIAAMVLSVGAVPVSAASQVKPKIEKVEYEGNGIVEVEFIGNVKYRNNGVVVKDSKGKTYKVRILKRDNDDIKFRVNNFKKGTAYNFTIKGVKSTRGGNYTTLKGKFKIPAAKKTISLAKAKAIALNNAKLNASQVRFTKAKLDYDDGIRLYEIEFRKGYVEYEYEIHATTGKIISKDVDYD